MLRISVLRMSILCTLVMFSGCSDDPVKLKGDRRFNGSYDPCPSLVQSGKMTSGFCGTIRDALWQIKTSENSSLECANYAAYGLERMYNGTVGTTGAVSYAGAGGYTWYSNSQISEGDRWTAGEIGVHEEIHHAGHAHRTGDENVESDWIYQKGIQCADDAFVL